jgi:hypothetical protein
LQAQSLQLGAKPRRPIHRNRIDGDTVRSGDTLRIISRAERLPRFRLLVRFERAIQRGQLRADFGEWPIFALSIVPADVSLHLLAHFHRLRPGGGN